MRLTLILRFISKLVDQFFTQSISRDRKERSASGGRRKPCTVLVQGKHRRDIRFS
jgi:translation initiation factor 1 (eIF-1/SUI1)